jgi:hypothetical protein
MLVIVELARISLGDNSGGTFPGEILPANSQSGLSWKSSGKHEVLGIKIKDTVVSHDLQGQPTILRL